jgi:hypothetical protein
MSAPYLRGNYTVTCTIVEPVISLEDLHTAEFERRCREVQSSGNGLGGSVPYVKVTRKDGKFLWAGDCGPTVTVP